MRKVLLIAPCLAALALPLYNRIEPELFGIPFFYWYQMAVIVATTLCLLIADLMRKA